MEYQSRHDALTGLPNRLSYQQDLRKYENALSSVSVVYCDINGLKQTNDLYGHDCGNQAIMETEKIIQYVDLFMFEEVCRTLAEWEQSGIEPIPISVNFSRITIMENRLIDKLREIMTRYGIPFSLIEIEITESVGKIKRQTIAEIGKNLKREGFPLSLDDFGTSYSSMSMLTVVEPDIMKPDRSLIRSLTENPKNQILIRSLVRLCGDLGIQIITEGVETQEQLELLEQLNCNQA